MILTFKIFVVISHEKLVIIIIISDSSLHSYKLVHDWNLGGEYFGADTGPDSLALTRDFRKFKIKEWTIKILRNAFFFFFSNYSTFTT